ncbi:hypothetical protein J2852_001085 [Azospirillum soli]|nr:hypothetical protein [Azospirillum soli]
MLRLHIAAACALLLSACSGNAPATSHAVPPQTAEISCPDGIDRSIDEDLRLDDLRNDVETQWPNGFGRPASPMERERLFPDC